ncbi:MAG: DUF1080 domain-containing protein [Bythopirellula sp.]|nr:DUF1080 domain-containing protein [Bythopirellula sp.]
MHASSSPYAAFLLALLLGAPLSAQSIEYLPGIAWPEPPVVTPGSGNCPPSDAIILFDGKDLSAWEGAEKWHVENGNAVVGGGNIKTKQSFGDCQLHIEWSSPQSDASGQGRSNSGIFLMETYELQVLDSYQAKTYPDGQAGAIYKQTPPMVNAMRPPGEWNVYDIAWTAPRFKDDGSLESPARITVFQNGVLIQNNFELQGGTYWHEPASYKQHAAQMPISLQDHGNPVRYRNIWVREVAPIQGTQAKTPSYVDHSTGKTWNAGEEPPGEPALAGGE